MSRKVVLSPDARLDIARLVEFVAVHDLGAAGRVRDALAEALQSLADFLERGVMAHPSDELRELKVKLGRYGYAIQYRVRDDEVFVAHLFHVREAR